MVNAAVEEMMYRGAVVGGLVESKVPTCILLPLQAIAFGTIHIGGFPRGWVGVSLATVYGFLLGVIRLRSRGLLAPWAGHVLTDLVIVAIVFSVARWARSLSDLGIEAREWKIEDGYSEI
ncbi:CPBP family intramembrane glutamic endopeptidase [Geotalea toluenoxydans]|uniref:CPBP family intramembrane glutamic endopeptidase n=1 Tax=Geotalea toluenoxydans TaxID=421624 RepID=UPI0006D1FDDA|nr:CPBP family intramembrane glutamic endopeptidase [Geotalea toluenoxydans]